MVKLLFCGDIDGNWSALVARLNELQQSAHGPFDALFIVGKYVEKPNVEDKAQLSSLPIKSFAFDKSFHGISMPNLETFCDHDVGIVTVAHNLTVGYLTGNATEQTSDFEYLKKVSSSSGYRGCDILVTSDWPREMHHFLDETELKDFKSLSIGIGSGSKVVSSVATLLKPRYHFVGGKGCFYQRSPYRNVGDANSCFTFTRLISIDKVSASKDKTKKWMHALSFNPIVNLSNKEVTEEPIGTTDCPYVTVGEKLVGSKQPATGGNSFINSANPAKRPRAENEAASGSGSFFFGNMGVPRGESGANVSLNLEAPSTSVTTLFIGGLSRDLTDYELKSSLPNAVLVKRPPGKAFAFVEFSSHAAAKKVVEASARHGLVVRGRTLTVGWGKEREPRTGGTDSAIYGGGSSIVYERQLVPPTSDAKTLFVGGLPSVLDAAHHSAPSDTAPTPDAATDTPTESDEAVTTPTLSPVEQALLELFAGAVLVSQVPGKSYAFVEFDSYDAAMAVVTRSIQETVSLQNRALTIGWAKGDVINSVLNHQQKREIISAAPSEDSRVLFVGNLSQQATESDVQSIFGSAKSAISSTRRPEGKDFAFVEFASPAEAQEAINIASATELLLFDAKVVVGWTRGRAADKSTQSADCWFCLASPVVKVHLVVSVGEHSYVALPRGGVTDLHVLIAPIDCVPSRVHLSVEAKAELGRYQQAIDALHRQAGYTAMRFERALRTRGSRDHMQVHVVPLAAHLVAGGKALSLFMQKASGAELKFHEIQDASKSIDEVVLSMEGGPFQEYFYIELPIAASDKSGPAAYRRFVYVNEDSGSRFPMQFGIELAAEIMGQPEKAHWKNCLLSEEGEQDLAEKFRDAFTPFDFTL